ncbi:MAG: Fic family protein [Methanomassiliicoccaceae archaeon]|nr:Fic family protein [Methanomassiliicoccaceae archaeon]
MYIHEKEGWTEFTWNKDVIEQAVRKLRFTQGKLQGMMEHLRPNAERRFIDSLTDDVMISSRIESEYLVEGHVRSSIHKRLGIEHQGKISRREDGVVEMIMDANQNCNLPLTKERLSGWHSSLMGSHPNITIGDYRKGSVAVVSGAMGKERIHYIAPDAERVDNEMKKFLKWMDESKEDDIIRSAVAHLWFVMIHPFDDGNGRVGRAISDMLLARNEGKVRYYSLSKRIYKERLQYYSLLEKAGTKGKDITEWMEWFISCVEHAVEDSITSVNSVLKKAEFWNSNSSIIMNERQNKMVNMILDDLLGELTSSRWARINHCSQDTAINDINDLIEKGILIKGQEGGRSTRYVLNVNKDV